MEADDVISWLCQKVEGPITVITGDRDMLQLVSPKVSVFNPYQKKTYTPHNFEKELEISQDKFVLYKCILGDSSDNVKGLERYGEKKAKKLAVELGSFDNLSNLTEEQRSILLKNRKLMDLNMGWPTCTEETKSYEDQFICAQTIKTDPTKLKEYAIKLEMDKLANNLTYWTDPFQTKMNDLVSLWFK